MTQYKINAIDRQEKALGHNKGLNTMGADVLNSTFVLPIEFLWLDEHLYF
jgi:hypothetical protein